MSKISPISKASLDIRRYFIYVDEERSCPIKDKPDYVKAWSQDRDESVCHWRETISIVDYLEEREQTNDRSTKLESDSLLMQGRLPEVYNRNFKAWKKRNKRNSSEAEYISNELGKMDEWMNILSSCDDYRRDHISVLQMYKDYLTTRQNYLSQTSDDILIQFIRIGKISPNWQNNKAGRFAYDNVNQCYRFYETDEKMNGWIVPEKDRSSKKCPIVACGFIAYVIKKWGMGSVAVYDGYIQQQLNEYKSMHEKDADVFSRDLDNEFYSQHIKSEEDRMRLSEGIFEYLSDKEANLIKEYTRYYFEYVSRKSPLNEPKANEDIDTRSDLDIISLRQGAAQIEQKSLKLEINPLATNNPQIENLYNLIDFLESVQNKFVEKAPLFNDLCELSKERDGLSPRNRFADKAKFDAIQINILEKLHEINPLYNEIKNKLEELDIWQREDVTGAGIYNKYVSIASALKENATAEKAQKAMFYLKKYTDFRKITKSMFFDLGFVFSNLDEVLKIIYDFFNDADTNEFDALLITKSS